MRESNYWLRLIDATINSSSKNNELIKLIDESNQLKNILGSILSKTNK